MDHPIAYEKKPEPTFKQWCQAPTCSLRRQFRVTVNGVTKELCGTHIGEAIRTALTFNLSHRSVRLGFEDEFREWI